MYSKCGRREGNKRELENKEQTTTTTQPQHPTSPWETYVQHNISYQVYLFLISSLSIIIKILFFCRISDPIKRIKKCGIIIYGINMYLSYFISHVYWRTGSILFIEVISGLSYTIANLVGYYYFYHWIMKFGWCKNWEGTSSLTHTAWQVFTRSEPTKLLTGSELKTELTLIIFILLVFFVLTG